MSTVTRITDRGQAESLQYLSAEIMNILNDSSALADALASILTAIKRETSFDAAGIRLKNGDDYPYFVQDGFSRDFLLTENMLTRSAPDGGLCKDDEGNCSLECTCGLVISGRIDPVNPFFSAGGSFWANDTAPLLDLPSALDPRTNPRNRCIHEGFYSVALIPIRAYREIVGLLQLNGRKKDCFTIEMIQFFEGISASIGVAVMRKQAEDALRTSEEQYRLAIKATNDAIYDLNLIENRIERNEVYTKTFGRPPHAKDSWQWWIDRIHPADRDRVVNGLREAIDGDTGIWTSEYRFPKADGTWADIYDRAHIARDETGDAWRVVGAMSDQTERKRAEEALRDSERRYHSLFESSLDGILLTQPDAAVLAANRRACEMFLMTEEEVIRAGRAGLMVEDEKLLAAVAERARTGKWQGELTARRSDGSTFPVEISSNLFVEADGKTMSAMVIRDITERRRAEDTLRKAHDSLELRVQERTAELSDAYDALQREMEVRKQAEEQLRQAHKLEAIGTLAGGIAHDFNNILASILGFTEMAIEDVADRPLVEKNLRNVLKSAVRARELVKQILAFSRRTNYERGPLSLTPVLGETVQLLRASIPMTIGIRLSISATSDTILAAPVEVSQVLINLVTNAALAMQHKGGTMEISLTDIDFEPQSPVLETDVAPGEYVQLMVKDSGIGMSQDVMKRAFEPFFTTRDVGEGTGMGLAVVYGIVKNLHGAITVESEPGVGSTFRVLLPKTKTQVEQEPINTAQMPDGKERVLFVDDEEMLVEWGRSTLERLGYTVTAVTNSTEALKTFSADPCRFDLVITDHTMSGMTGLQLSKEILKVKPGTPIILCTGHSETVSPDIAKEAGIREYLMKPLSRHELAQTVRLVLDTRPPDAN
jgi:PAS domain S-box-containing protein